MTRYRTACALIAHATALVAVTAVAVVVPSCHFVHPPYLNGWASRYFRRSWLWARFAGRLHLRTSVVRSITKTEFVTGCARNCSTYCDTRRHLERAAQFRSECRLYSCGMRPAPLRLAGHTMRLPFTDRFFAADRRRYRIASAVRSVRASSRCATRSSTTSRDATSWAARAAPESAARTSWISGAASETDRPAGRGSRTRWSWSIPPRKGSQR